MQFHIWKMFESYNKVSKRIDSLKTSKKDMAISFIFSFLLSLLIVSGPICILINLLIIFEDAQKIICFFLATTGVIFFFLFEYFYYKIITKDKVAGMKIILFTDTFIFAIVIYIILVLIYMIGVI